MVFPGVASVFQWNFKGILRMLHKCFMFFRDILRELQERLKDGSRAFRGCLEGVSRMFKMCSKFLSGVIID